MKRFFDKSRNALIYVEKKANPNFWDEQWEKERKKKNPIVTVSRFDIIVSMTKKYVKSKGKILEGGCGMGQNVVKLSKSNFDCVGLDYAQKVIEINKKNFPNNKFIMGDVFKLPFKKNTFDGYWSIGVIEHFYDGYEKIIDEMYRVLKPGANVFITFPHMSKIRRFKAKRNKYDSWEENSFHINNFYQFALDEKQVIKHLKKKGFEINEVMYFDGIKGLKDEISSLKKPLQYLYNAKFLPLQMIRIILSKILARFFSHSILIVATKNNVK